MVVKRAYKKGKPYLTDMREVAPGKFLTESAANALAQLMSDKDVSRKDLRAIRSAFRTYAQQLRLWDKYGSPRAARPGYSNHQRGLAMDVDEPLRSIMVRHGSAYGWVRPIKSEPWHFEYRGGAWGPGATKAGYSAKGASSSPSTQSQAKPAGGGGWAGLILLGLGALAFAGGKSPRRTTSRNRKGRSRTRRR